MKKGTGNQIVPVRFDAETLARVDKALRQWPDRWANRSEFVREMVRGAVKGVELTLEENPHATTEANT